MSKIMIAGLAVIAMGGTAVAQDPPADGEGGGGDTTGGDTTGGGDAAAPPAGDPAGDPAMAPAGAKGSKVIGIDVGGALPLGDFADAADFGIAVLGRFEFGINDMLAVTGRVGLTYWLAKEPISSYMFIPVYAGIKYNIGTSGLFASAEAGITHIRASVDFMGMSASDSETKFGALVGAGFQKGKIQARAGLWLPSLGDAGDGQAIMATIGYDVVAL
jgi:hypothetical protein